MRTGTYDYSNLPRFDCWNTGMPIKKRRNHRRHVAANTAELHSLGLIRNRAPGYPTISPGEPQYLIIMALILYTLIVFI